MIGSTVLPPSLELRRGDQQLTRVLVPGPLKNSATGAVSTTRPFRITATRSQMSATTPRLWVTRTIPEATLVAQLADEIEHLRLHGDVERRGRLVGDDQLRVGRDRARDEHALRHATGDLVRVLPHDVLGVRDARPGGADQPAVPRPRRRHRAAPHAERRRAAGGWSWSGRGWSSAPVARRRSAMPRTGPQRVRCDPRISTPSNRTEPPRTAAFAGQDAEHRERCLRLAGARLADETDDLAATHVEIDAAHDLAMLVAARRIGDPQRAHAQQRARRACGPQIRDSSAASSR